MTRRLQLIIAACAATTILTSTALADDGFDPKITSSYEKDAWYDVSEWFDGNKYNPTDEALGRWDDEQFDAADAATSNDRDNDRSKNKSNYGYRNTTAENDRWFYDYFDDGYAWWYDGNRDGIYDGHSFYHDYDNDGLYDAYSYSYDRNNDGIYEDVGYYSFGTNNTSKDSKQRGQQASNQQKNAPKAESISGTIQGTKTVQVHGNKHLLAHLKTGDGKTVSVDLGSNTQQQLSKDKKLEASGPRLSIGDKNLIVATTARLDGQELTIQRDGRRFEGKVEDTREVQVRSKKHLLAKINTSDNKKLLVDLGPVDKLSSKPSKGQQVTVNGVPVKASDRLMLMARSITIDGKQAQIDRRQDRTTASEK